MTIKVMIGDVLAQLALLPDESVDCVVTSPPYWGLRDYGIKGQLGLEATLGEHIENIVAVFEQVKRVLKKTGTCWVNYGDCYATAPNGRSAADTKKVGNDDRTFRDKPFSTIGPIYPPNSKDPFRKEVGRRGGGQNKDANLKAKDLCMMPNRIAIALQEAGWWVRSEIVWFKNNPMPESVIDRPATAHEKIWLLTKNDVPSCWHHRETGEWVFKRPHPEYQWINRATGAKTDKPHEGKEWRRINLWRAFDYYYDADAVRTDLKGSSIARLSQDIENQDGSARANGGQKTNGPMKAVGGKKEKKQRGHGRRHDGFNERWDQMTREEQQATGANLKNVWTMATRGFPDAHFATFPPDLPEKCIMAGCPVSGVVLDPFGGAGTTALVADRLGRDAILIELNPAYVDMSIKRITNDAPLFVRFETPRPDQRGDQARGKSKPQKRKSHEQRRRVKSKSRSPGRKA